MKKYIIVAIMAVASFSACTREEDYCARLREIKAGYETFCNEIMNDKVLTEEQLQEKVYAEFDKVRKQVDSLAVEAFKTHTDDSVAVDMIEALYIFQIRDEENLKNLIASMGPSVQESGRIKDIVKVSESVLRTAEGAQFLDFSATQPDGSVASLSDYAGKGKYCLVVFWASWCNPCREEISQLQKIYDKYGTNDLEMVSVAVWDKPQESIDTAAAYGIRWHQIVNAQSIPTELYGVEGIPYIFLIGPDGTIAKRDLYGDDIFGTLKRFLR